MHRPLSLPGVGEFVVLDQPSMRLPGRYLCFFSWTAEEAERGRGKDSGERKEGRRAEERRAKEALLFFSLSPLLSFSPFLLFSFFPFSNESDSAARIEHGERRTRPQS